MAFIEASLEELPVSANLGQSCLATKISAPGPSSFGWFRHSSSSRSSLAQGQIPQNSIVGMATIDALIAAVLTILPKIARNPRSLIQGKTPIRTTRARARNKWCKSDRGGLISLLLQSFPKEHQSCRVLSLSTINPQSYYLIPVQLIVLYVPNLEQE